MNLDSKINLSSAPEKETKIDELVEEPAAQETEAPVSQDTEPTFPDESEEMPVLIPDDYDADEIDYSEGKNLSDVVSAKGEVQEAPRYQRPKLKGREAWENFWYHHKLKVFVITGLVVLLGTAAILSIPVKYDNVFHIFADTQLGLYSMEDVMPKMAEYCEDENEDGEVLVNVIFNNINSRVDAYSHIAAYMALDTELGGEYTSFLWVVDRLHYDYVVELLGENTFEAYEDYPTLISLKGCDLIPPAPDSYGNETELFFVLLSIPEDRMDDAELVARHDSAVEVLGRILEAYPEMSANALQTAEQSAE